MAVPAEDNVKRARRSRLPAGAVGARIVASELQKRGLQVQLDDHLKCDVLIRRDDRSMMPVQVRTVHVSPWYVPSSSFVGKASQQVTVYVLLGSEKARSTRFFIARNADVATKFRRPSNEMVYGFIDLDSLKEYEDDWSAIA
jgi:hypothetical protein